MKPNPYLHAALAALYIIGIVGVVTFFFSGGSEGDGDDFIIIPITMLSLLTLSVSVMAYLFLYQPIVLLLEKREKDALMFFGKTVGAFAVCAAVFAAILIATT